MQRLKVNIARASVNLVCMLDSLDLFIALIRKGLVHLICNICFIIPHVSKFSNCMSVARGSEAGRVTGHSSSWNG